MAWCESRWVGGGKSRKWRGVLLERDGMHVLPEEGRRWGGGVLEAKPPAGIHHTGRRPTATAAASKPNCSTRATAAATTSARRGPVKQGWNRGTALPAMPKVILLRLPRVAATRIQLHVPTTAAAPAATAHWLAPTVVRWLAAAVAEPPLPLRWRRRPRGPPIGPAALAAAANASIAASAGCALAGWRHVCRGVCSLSSFIEDADRATSPLVAPHLSALAAVVAWDLLVGLLPGLRGERGAAFCRRW
mmetsp:Transcript_137589/g.343359  ORF Transcript_137589/g.343359 Transcript_137589/m.343359 type:complete len:247 (-) Transcript_137589:709-1449(-)